MRLTGDCGAVESIPLRLMIVAVVVSLSILPAAGALDTFRNRDLVRRVALELDEMMAVAQVMAIQGPGNARTLTFDLRGDGSLQFDRLTIGDSAGGPNMSSAVLRFTNGAVLSRSALEPTVWLRSGSGEALTVDTPFFRLRLESILDKSVLYIVAEAG
ncbi:MAG: hypothetical protein JW880_08625 [Candidatus Thermoplasmatota archaeon]|nr:hypothetical protein [Candidatus Thermoplasmatota archaeon]